MIHITSHAVERYIERVHACSIDDAIEALSSAIILKAADFGAHYVRLGTGQRIVLDGHRVITVLPIGHKAHRMSTQRDCRFKRESEQGEFRG